MESTEAGRESINWWGTFTVEEEQTGRWEVGPSTFWVYRSAQEWRILHIEVDAPLRETAAVVLPVPKEELSASLEALGPEVEVSRYSFRKTDPRLIVSPVLADRAVIVQPERPLYVPEGEAVTIYVSTPLWVRFEVGVPGRMLQEFPSQRPSDTWFGPSTREGVLCYASSTAGRVRLSEVPFWGYRAVTPLAIHNKARKALLVEKVHLPIEHLSLYQAENQVLWTERVTLERERDGDLAAVEVDENAPPEAPKARFLRGPRQPPSQNVVMRAFSSIFHKITEG